MINIDKLIMESMKAHNQARTLTLRAIKTEMLNWKSSKENVGKTMTEADETTILKRMVKQRKGSAEEYITANREDLAKIELAEVAVIEEFLPATVTEKEIETEFNRIVETGVEASKKNMGVFMKMIRQTYPGADGKMVSAFVSSKLS